MTSYAHDYDLWRAALDGIELQISPDRIGLGFWLHYRRSGGLVGVATFEWNGELCVKYGWEPTRVLTDEAESDWSWGTFAYLMAVDEPAYRQWAATGSWPAEVEARARGPKSKRYTRTGASA